MPAEIVDFLDILLDEETRIYRKILKVEKNKQFPKGIKFTFNYLLKVEDEWINLVRYDNSMHEKGKIGGHLHRYGKEEVEFVEIPLHKIHDYIVRIGEEIKRRIKNGKD